MELRHLRYFYETANEMNFTRAAEKLNIAQPPLSRQIKDLEEELGVELFVRRPHYLALTPEGELLKQYAAQILGLSDRAMETVREMGQGLNGTIYIALVEGHTLRSLSRWIRLFSEINPAVQYNLWTGTADEINVRVKNGLCDFAIIGDLIDTDGIGYYRLYQEPWTALIHRDNPLAQQEGDTVSTKALLPYDLIIPSRNQRYEEINHWFRDSETKPSVRCRYTNVLSAYELARQGIGISIYPGDAKEIIDTRDDGLVAAKRIVNPSMTATYYIIFNKSRVLSNVSYEFIAFIRERSRAEKAGKEPEEET